MKSDVSSVIRSLRQTADPFSSQAPYHLIKSFGIFLKSRNKQNNKIGRSKHYRHFINLEVVELFFLQQMKFKIKDLLPLHNTYVV